MNKPSLRAMLHVFYLKTSGVPETGIGTLAGSRLFITMLMKKSRLLLSKRDPS